ncbi:MAG: twin-arginine translocase TatA/TatE family subunit [Chloroflexota bacterium]|nr:twin-arginine translocase TatA/TatE family subunit [Chloroflexota bacterium]
MFGIGTGEILLILVIAMLVVGPERMVSFARDAGRLLAEFHQETDSVTKEFREALSVEPEEEGAGQEDGGGASAAAPAAGGDAVLAAGAGDQKALPGGQVAAENEEDEGLPVGAQYAFIDGETEPFDPDGEGEDGADEKPVLIIVGEPVPKDEDVEPIVIEGPVLIDEKDVEEGEG